MKVGYIRVSTEEQNTARQEVLMEQLGVDRIYIDKISGKSKERPQLKEMLGFVRMGDTVIVESISRFARNTRDLLELIDLLTEKGVEFVSRKESIDTTTPAGKFMLTVFAAVAELERGYILERQREGIAMGTVYRLINSIIIPNIQYGRLIVAINQADMAMSGRHWDKAENAPDPILAEFLREKAVSVKNRIREATGVNVPMPVCYSAEKDYNITSFLDLIVDSIPSERRPLAA